MLIDTHCHLDAAEFDPDRDAVATRAVAAGVRLAVVPAVEVANFAAVEALAARGVPPLPGTRSTPYPVPEDGARPEAAARSTAPPSPPLPAGPASPPAPSSDTPPDTPPPLGGLCVAPAYGIHPLYVPGASDADLATLATRLEAALAGPYPPVAVGEIGLDGFVPALQAPDLRARQEALFLAQLKLARDFGLPVILHIRRAQDTVLKYLRQVFGKGGSPGGIAHAFNGSAQQAHAFLDLGLRLGFGGTLTYDGSQRIRRLAATLPDDALVLETDAPDIPPAFAPRQRNEPAHLAAIAAVLGELRGLDPDEVAALTSGNARAALPGLAAYATP